MIKKILAVFTLCFIIIGIVVIFYWRDTHYLPDKVDLINYLLWLPITASLILLSPWLIYRVYQYHQNKKQQRVLQHDSDDNSIVEQKSSKQLVWIKLNIYAARAYSALGEGTEILEVMQQGIIPAPALDPELLNGYGQSILSYRIEDMDQQIDDSDFLQTLRQQRIMVLIRHELEQQLDVLNVIAEHLKRSSLFYESQHVHEYRMHPAWIDPDVDYNDEEIDIKVEQIYRLEQLNLHILLSEDLLHVWDDQDSTEWLQAFFYGIGLIPQKLHIEYHFVSEATGHQQWSQLLEHIQKQPYHVSLLISVDSEIDQSTIDEKMLTTGSYIPAEYVASCCIAAPEVQLLDLQPSKTMELVLEQNDIVQIFKTLKIENLAQYENEDPFVLVVEDTNIPKVVKKLEQFFAPSSVEPHHYLYCKSSLGHTQNLAKIYGLMLGMHFPETLISFVYGQDFLAFIRAFPESEQAQENQDLMNI